VILEDLCAAEGVPCGEFIGSVAATGMELGFDVGGLFAGIGQMVEALTGVIAKAQKPGGYRAHEQFFEAVRILRGL
jgi:hypothetical protein